MNKTHIKKGTPDSYMDFSRLILFSASKFSPIVFGKNVSVLMGNLFKHSHNLFSYEHTEFICKDDKVKGMSLGYDWSNKKKEDISTLLLLMRYLKSDLIKNFFILMKADRVVGKVAKYEFYISNIAIYPEFRSLGLGEKLLLSSEKKH